MRNYDVSEAELDAPDVATIVCCSTVARQTVNIRSLKSNSGHLGTAAGIAPPSGALLGSVAAISPRVLS